MTWQQLLDPFKQSSGRRHITPREVIAEGRNIDAAWKGRISQKRFYLRSEQETLPYLVKVQGLDTKPVATYQKAPVHCVPKGKPIHAS